MTTNEFNILTFYNFQDGLISYYKYKPQIHDVKTEDGYILKVFRCNSNVPITKVLIMMHGIVENNNRLVNFKYLSDLNHFFFRLGVLSSSDDFCMNVPEQSPAYVFADAGFDVFLPNCRGNVYSKRHATLSPLDPKFWDFSFHEIGIYDYPAVVKFVRKLTGYQKVYVVAHSQGTSAFMAWLSERPQDNQYVAAASLLAPVGWLCYADDLYQTLGIVQPALEVSLAIKLLFFTIHIIFKFISGI